MKPFCFNIFLIPEHKTYFLNIFYNMIDAYTDSYYPGREEEEEGGDRDQ